MNTQLLVSIVINNYNYGHFLREAVDSALQQTYEPIEVIVVDDGSTDNSRALIAEYGERIIPILKENGGQASALNAGFAQSQGEIVIFLDADDVLHMSIAEKVVTAYTDAPEAARVHYRLQVVDTRGEQTGIYVPPAYLPLAAGDLRERTTALVNGTNWPPTSGNAFSSWSLRCILPMSEEVYRTCADYYLLRANALCGPVAALEEVGGYYRLHTDNTFLTPELNVDEVRQQIALVQATGDCLRQFLDRVKVSEAPDKYGDLVERYDEIYLAQRMVSLKLEPVRHPLAKDTLRSLSWRGARAAVHRVDLSAPLKLVHVLWFAAMLVAPRSVARDISRQLLPISRTSMDPLFKTLQTGGRA